MPEPRWIVKSMGSMVEIKRPMSDPRIPAGNWLRTGTSTDHRLYGTRAGVFLPHAYPDIASCVRLDFVYLTSGYRTYVVQVSIDWRTAALTLDQFQRALQVAREFEATRVMELPIDSQIEPDPESAKCPHCGGPVRRD